MRLVKIEPNKVHRDEVLLGRCLLNHCTNKVFTGSGYADLDGEPFVAYYCPSCARKLIEAHDMKEVEPCVFTC